MALEQEPLAEAVARADCTVRFTATAGEENGPYSWDRYALVRGEDRYAGVGMDVMGKVLTVRFAVLVQAGDVVEVPGG